MLYIFIDRRGGRGAMAMARNHLFTINCNSPVSFDVLLIASYALEEI